MGMKVLATLLVTCLLFAVPQSGEGAEEGCESDQGPPVRLSMLASGALSLEGVGAEATGEATPGQASPQDLLLSALLPGLGELRTGHRNMAAIHLTAEAAVWVSFIVFRVQGGLRQDDYVEYAEVFAGIRNVSGRSDGYYKDLARYIRSDPGPNSYNEKEVRETARALYPDDPEARRRYIDAHEITGDLAWNWESVEQWRAYRDLRESSELSFQRSRFCIAAAVANRIASVLGLARTRGPSGSTIDVGLRPAAGSEHLMTTVSLRMRF